MATVLTLLTTPKAFTGLFDTIQTNAITSWAHLEPRPEIILFGEDEGTAELSERLGCRHVPDVACTAEGTPLLSDMFERGQQLASNEVVCWSNADIIYTPSILTAARTVAGHPRPALLVGRRRDIDQSTLIDFTDPGWADRLRRRAEAEGTMMGPVWIDYFMFRPGLFRDLPDFAIGRPGYDNWLLWRAQELGADLIDATPCVWAIHQRHDYSHAGGRRRAWEGAEAARNDELIGDWRHKRSIAYADLTLGADGRLDRATGLVYRLARPRSVASQALSFLRPLRRRLQGERPAWRGRAGRAS